MIEVSAFKWVPPFARGLVRDLRVRWALEEAGLPYRSKPIDFVEQASDAYRALQPFAQVPSYREGDLTLFESGAIVLHVARRSPALMPEDEAGRERATTEERSVRSSRGFHSRVPRTCQLAPRNVASSPT